MTAFDDVKAKVLGWSICISTIASAAKFMIFVLTDLWVVVRHGGF